MTTVVVLSAIPGVLGLLLGRWLADVKGRRIAVAIGVLATAATSLYAYSGGRPAFVIGYVLGVFAGGLFTPGAAAIATEPFPSEVRASAGGWIVVAAVLGAIAGLAVFGTVSTRPVGRVGGVRGLPPWAPALLWLRRFPETKGLVLA